MVNAQHRVLKIGIILEVGDAKSVLASRISVDAECMGAELLIVSEAARDPAGLSLRILDVFEHVVPKRFRHETLRKVLGILTRKATLGRTAEGSEPKPVTRTDRLCTLPSPARTARPGRERA